MQNNLIAFENIDWDKSNTGVEQKTYSREGKKIRLLIFRDNFVEHDWCLKGHIGFVLDGKMTVDFNGKKLCYKKEDGIWIEEGLDSKHKVTIEKGEFVKLVLFEESP